MPNYRAVTNGNWSSLATWQDNATGSFVASTVLPGVNDDVYSNNFIVGINQNVNVLSIRNTSATNITAGGRFLLTNGITVNATGTGLVNNSSTTVLIEFNLAAPNSATIITSALAGTPGNQNGNGHTLLSNTGTLTLTVNSTWSLNGVIVNVTGNGVFNLFGSGGHAGQVGSQTGINLAAANATLNWTGNLTNHSVSTNWGYIANSGGFATTSTVNMVGNIRGADSANGFGIFTNGIFNLTGIAEPNTLGSSNSAAAVFAQAGSNVTINGIARSNTNRVVAINSTGLVTVSGQINCVNEGWPIIATRLRLANAIPTQITFQTDSVGVNKTLYEPGTALGNPATSNVRQGVSYASGALTGTLVVPSPANVRRGVPTDNTVGTADLTAQDFFTAIANSSDPIAVRLRNVATVQTTGDQIAAAL